jgi:hypothetical protein
MLRQLAVLIAFNIASTTITEAKCARLLIHVSGEIQGDDNSRLAVEFEVLPDVHVPQRSATRDGPAFHAELSFDSTKAVRWFRGHDCSRVPMAVRVMLMRGDHVLERRELSFSRDFVRDASGYRIRRPVIFTVS